MTRNRQFTLYLNDEEYAKLQVLSAAYAMPMSTYVRTVSLGDALGQSFTDVQMLFKQSQQAHDRT